MNVVTVLLMIAKYADVIAAVVDSIESGKLTKDGVLEAMKAAMTAASDDQMRKEFPNG